MYQLGKRRPPKTPLRRIILAAVVLVFCAGLLPFIVGGVALQWQAGSIVGVIAMGWIALFLILGIGAGVYGIAVGVRERRNAPPPTPPR
ncbi:hypothetical protein IF188_18140 [Microbacterium sp. NEAU-LLC]|uniref:Uncharacterized protein n=1 Tax=Microbacterium helvum TaxID=2773713 RepID=A0ABR8NX17_9MICO|nr:hypothetical protein [Microbacterium helvum]MBD3943616.1 hypothetical protein [Microbacterium helvum]